MPFLFDNFCRLLGLGGQVPLAPPRSATTGTQWYLNRHQQQAFQLFQEIISIFFKRYLFIQKHLKIYIFRLPTLFFVQAPLRGSFWSTCHPTHYCAMYLQCHSLSCLVPICHCKTCKYICICGKYETCIHTRDGFLHYFFMRNSTLRSPKNYETPVLEKYNFRNSHLFLVSHYL